MLECPEEFVTITITSKYIRSITFKLQQNVEFRHKLWMCKHSKNQSPLIERYTMKPIWYENKGWRNNLIDFIKDIDPNAKFAFSNIDNDHHHIALAIDDEVWAYGFQTLKTTGAIKVNLKPTRGRMTTKRPTDTEPRYFTPYDKNGELRIKKRKKLVNKDGSKTPIFITQNAQDAIDGYNLLVERALKQLHQKVKYLTNNYIGPLPEELKQELSITHKPKDKPNENNI